MKKMDLEVQVRTDAGKGVARKLRGAGRIPGVLYGPKTQPISLSIEALNFNKMLAGAQGEQILFNLALNNNGASESRLALAKSMQFHPVNDAIRHVDFYEVQLDQQVEIEVPISIVGEAKGVKLDKGIMEVIQRSLKVSCLPTNMPKEISVDVSALGLGEALHAGDVVPPEGVKLLADPKTTLVTIVAGAAAEGPAEGEEGAEAE